LVLAFLLLGVITTDRHFAVGSSPVPSANDTTEKKLYYYVELSTGGGSFNVTLNGRPYLRATSAGGEAKSAPANVDLVGENNKLHVVAGPTTGPFSRWCRP
jgi:hypothetical protein